MTKYPLLSEDTVAPGFKVSGAQPTRPEKSCHLRAPRLAASSNLQLSAVFQAIARRAIASAGGQQSGHLATAGEKEARDRV